MTVGGPGHRRRRTGSLRFRVTALATVAVLAVLTSVGVGITLTHRAVLVDSLDESLGDRAEAIAQRLRSGEPIEQRDLPTDDVLIQVVDADGTVLAASKGVTGRPWRETPQATTVRDGELPGGGAARVLATPVDGATVYVAGTLEDVEASSRVLLRTLAVAVPLSTALLAGLVWVLVGRVLQPVEDIRSEVDRISASQLDRRVPEPPTADEIARLAHTMNAMLDRLARAADRQRRFVADAAHELRSPLARMRTELEVDAAHPASADVAATASSVLAQTLALQRLVDDLLLLAREDASPAPTAQLVPVDLDDVVDTVVRSYRDPRIMARDVTPVQVLGSRTQLERVVANLLDNAVRHAGDRIEVGLDGLDGIAELTVSNDGPGISADDAEHVFERFTRLDDARTAGTGGAGLGLAIARGIAVRHGGSLVVDPSVSTGARFVLRLPRHPAGGNSV